MNELRKLLLERGNHKLLMPYLTVGYPSLSRTIEAVGVCVKEGCDAVELGIPFSDPLADGVTIQRASHGALENGVSPEICLETAAEIHRRFHIPLIFMTYLNPIYRYGITGFCRRAAEAGIRGLIVPDLPPDEAGEAETAAIVSGIDLIYLAAPNSSEVRLKLVAERTTSFIYVVSLVGVTGARDRIDTGLTAFISRLRAVTDKPLCVGFGISTPLQVSQAVAVADGVIIGSRIMQILESGESSLVELGSYLKEARAAAGI